MNEKNRQCPDDQMIADYLSGSLKETQLAAIENHISRCEFCRRLVADLARDPSVPEEISNKIIDSALQTKGGSSANGVRLSARSCDRYQRITEIGRGGLGLVHQVYDQDLGRMIALKELPQVNGETQKRFAREARITAKLQHPGIVPVYDAGVDEQGKPFYTMRLIAGRSLKDMIGTRCNLTERLELVSNLLAAASAVAYAHDNGVIHRDIKPANIMVGDYGETVVIDWGLARLMGDVLDKALVDVETSVEDPSITKAGSVLGTPAYMAPEQARGDKIDRPTDVYALGATLYHVLTGKPPSRGDSASRALQYIAQGEQLIPIKRYEGIPQELAAIVCKAMEPDPFQRYRDAGEFARDIRRYVAGRLVTAMTERFCKPNPQTEQDMFVGRAEELQKLQKHFADARNKKCPPLHITAPSGYGKTALVGYFAANLQERFPDLLVLRGTCCQGDGASYRGIRDIVEHLARYLRSFDHAHAAGYRPLEADMLCRIFPVLASVPSFQRDEFEVSVPGLTSRRKAFVALRELLARLADKHPTLIFIDDLQWIDEDGEACLAALLGDENRPRCAVVLCSRIETESGFAPVSSSEKKRLNKGKEMLPRDTQIIQLGVLREKEAESLASAILRKYGRDEKLAVEISRHAGGNPLFVSQLAQPVATEGSHANGLDKNLKLVSLDRAIAMRYAGLAKEAQLILRLLAMAAVPISYSVLLKTNLFNQQSISFSKNRLCEEGLLRIIELSTEQKLAPSHDRIREVIRANIEEDEARHLSKTLAKTLLSETNSNNQELAFHLLVDAGETEQAMSVVDKAADHAARQLAFARVVEIRSWAAEATRQQMGDSYNAALEKLSYALEFAGQFVRAAEANETAAKYATSSNRAVEFRERSMTLFLRGGERERGLAVANTVLKEMGVKYSTDKFAVVINALKHLPLVLGKGMLRQDHQTTQEENRRLRILWSVQSSIGTDDPWIMMALQPLFLNEAYRSGDVGSIALASGMLAVITGSMGPIAKHVCNRALASADKFAENSGDEYIKNCVKVLMGWSHVQDGNFAMAAEVCLKAAESLETGGYFSGYEISLSHSVGLTSLVQLGRFREVTQKLPPILAEAKQRGNVFLVEALESWGTNMYWLSRDEPDVARQNILRHWNPQQVAERIGLYQMLMLCSLISVDLYEGDTIAARGRLGAYARDLKRSGLLRVQHNRSWWNFIAARSALRHAAVLHRPSPSGQIMALLKRMRKESVVYYDAFVELYEAPLLADRGWTSDAVNALGKAIDLFEQLEAPVWLALARWRLGELLKGGEGADLVAQAKHSVKEQGIVAPRRFLDAFAPWPKR